MKGAELLAHLMGGVASGVYLVTTAGWGVFGIMIAINFSTCVVARLVK